MSRSGRVSRYSSAISAACMSVSTAGTGEAGYDDEAHDAARGSSAAAAARKWVKRIFFPPEGTLPQEGARANAYFHVRRVDRRPSPWAAFPAAEPPAFR